MSWYFSALSKYIQFCGRARRREYWFFLIISMLIGVLLSCVGEAFGGGRGVQLEEIYSLLVLLPAIGVMIRRLHDSNRSGWWALISIIPVIGTVIMIYFMACPGTVGPNRFGADPIYK